MTKVEIQVARGILMLLSLTLRFSSSKMAYQGTKGMVKKKCYNFIVFIHNHYKDIFVDIQRSDLGNSILKSNLYHGSFKCHKI